MGSINELIQSDHQYHKEEPKVLPVPTTPFSSNVSTSLLDGRQVITTVPSSHPSLPLSAQPTTLQSAAMVSSSSACLAGPTGLASRGRPTRPSPFSSSKMSMTTMVDPNMVYSPRPRVPELSQLDDSNMDNSSLLSPDMLESLDGLLSLEDLVDLSDLDQKPDPSQKAQQTVITSSSPPPSGGSAAVSKNSTQRKTSTLKTTRAVKQEQPAHVFSNSKPKGHQPVPGQTEGQDGYLSPDSGFVSDSSDGSLADLSDSSPSPASLSSPDMEALGWQEDFINVSMDLQLFPDVGLSI